jgi:ATPase subunit of ABC transporter with duplicated ATPase domains
MADKQLNHQRTTWLGSKQSITIRYGLIGRNGVGKR